MLISELIEILQRYDGDEEVVFGNDYVHEIHNVRIGSIRTPWGKDDYQCVIINGDQIGREI